jgi:hypothetical protein
MQAVAVAGQETQGLRDQVGLVVAAQVAQAQQRLAQAQLAQQTPEAVVVVAAVKQAFITATVQLVVQAL